MVGRRNERNSTANPSAGIGLCVANCYSRGNS
jgi:hypothetical protein